MAGFLDLLIGFLLEAGFILRVRKVSFLGDHPLTVDVPNRTADTLANTTMMTVSRLAGTPHGGWEGGVYTGLGGVPSMVGGYPWV